MLQVSPGCTAWPTTRCGVLLSPQFAEASPLEVKRTKFQWFAKQRVRNEAFSQRCDLEYKLGVSACAFDEGLGPAPRQPCWPSSRKQMLSRPTGAAPEAVAESCSAC